MLTLYISMHRPHIIIYLIIRNFKNNCEHKPISELAPTRRWKFNMTHEVVTHLSTDHAHFFTVNQPMHIKHCPVMASHYWPAHWTRQIKNEPTVMWRHIPVQRVQHPTLSRDGLSQVWPRLVYTAYICHIPDILTVFGCYFRTAH